MQIKYWLILITIGITVFLILLFCQYLIFIFPNQPFDIINNDYWIIIEFLLDKSEYNDIEMFNQPSFIFTILNALILGVYLNCLNLVIPTKKVNSLIIFIVIWIIFSCFGMFGLRITFNFPFLIYQSYTSNTAEGILFFIMNLTYFCLIYILSFLIESETKN